MLRFEGLVNQDGVAPNGTFMVVPEGGASFVCLRDADGAKLSLALPYLVDVVHLTRGLAHLANQALGSLFSNWGVERWVSEAPKKNLYRSAIHNPRNFTKDSRLYLVTGKSRGQTSLVATLGRVRRELEIAVVSHRHYSVAFKFVRHLDSSGTTIQARHYDPNSAKELLDELNWIYGPQANISFSLEEADWVEAGTSLGHPVPYQELLDLIKRWKNKHADLNVFVVGGKNIASPTSIASGMYFGQFNENAVAVMDGTDNPSRSDPNLTNVAHEIAHFLSDERGGPSDYHHHRNGVLMSRKEQSTLLDKGVLLTVNPP